MGEHTTEAEAQSIVDLANAVIAVCEGFDLDSQLNAICLAAGCMISDSELNPIEQAQHLQGLLSGTSAAIQLFEGKKDDQPDGRDV